MAKRKAIDEYFIPFRMNEKHHLGMGDIRVTMRMIDELKLKIRSL